MPLACPRHAPTALREAAAAPYFLAESSSVRPHVPTGGWLKTSSRVRLRCGHLAQPNISQSTRLADLCVPGNLSKELMIGSDRPPPP